MGGGKTVLDFGCGNGRYLLNLKENNPSWNLYGFDIGSNETVHNIGKHKDITILIGNDSTLWNNFPENTFDIINLSHVLEHLNNPKDVLRNLRRLLKENGKIYINVPNIDTIKFRIFGKNFSNLDAPRHLYHFSPKTLAVLCKQSGLTITKLEICGTTKSTLRSIYIIFGIKSRLLHPIAYSIIDTLTKIVGVHRINTEAMCATCRK